MSSEPKKYTIKQAAHLIRSGDEAKKMGRAGGVASGKSRRLKAELKKQLQVALSLPAESYLLANNDLIGKLDNKNYHNLIVANLVLSAVHGKSTSINAILKLLD